MTRRLLAMAVTVVLTAAGIAVAEPASALVAFTSTAVNQNGSNCMTLPGGNATNLVQLTQAGCTSATYQNFTFNPYSTSTDTYTIATSTPGKCVDVNGASTADN